MVYTYDNKYYIIRPGKLVEIIAKINENGDLDFVPTSNEVKLSSEIEYSSISVDKIKEKLLEKKKEVKEEVKFNNYDENKKINKFNKTI